MFQFPATISFISDFIIALLYFVEPTVFGDSYSHSWWEVLDLYNSFLALVILAALRTVLMVSEVFQFQKDKRMIKINTVYGFLLFNVIVVVIKTSVSSGHISIFQAVAIFGSFLSICCQVICLRHLKSSVLPVRHVVLGLSLRSLKLHHGLPQHDHSSDEQMLKHHSMSVSERSELLPLKCPAHQQPDATKHDCLVCEEEHVSRNHLAVTRGIWHSKIEGIKALVHKMRGGAAGGSSRSPSHTSENSLTRHRLHSSASSHHEDAFDLILYLFVGDAHSDRVVERLELLFAQYPQEVEFYLPQLTIYLLYGSFGARGPQLKSAMLRMCTHSLPFALKFHWFVSSFCLSEAGVEGAGVHALMTLTAEIEACGEIAANQLISDLRGSKSRMPSTGNTQYSMSMRFWLEMVTISRTLGATPRPTRQDVLRRLVRESVGSFLPSATVHVPFRNTKHRVWAVHADECYAFSSVDRAPVLLILEVLSFGTIKKRDEEDAKWWIPRLSGSKSHLSKAKGAHRSGYRELTSSTSDDEKEEGRSEKRPLPETAMSTPDSYYQAEDSADMSSPKNGAKSSAYDAYSSMCRPSRSLDIGQWTSPMNPSSATNANTRTKHNSFNKRWTGPRSLPASAAPIADIKRTLSKSLLSASLAASRNLGEEIDLEAALDDRSNTVTREVVLSSQAVATVSTSESSKPSRLEYVHPGERSFDRSDMAPSVVFKERWRSKEERIRRDSPIGHLDGWRLVPVIVKSNDDLRQEQCASQLIALMHKILHASVKCGSGLRPYEIVAMSPDSGLIEAIPDTVSLHALRSKEFGYESLLGFFEQYFGPQDSPAFLRAQDHFIKSLADYSIVCYLLQIKDRHNGNMLLTTHGHIVHIDFGFLLGKTPGDVGFEQAPFKLTRDFVELMGGEHSKTFHKFRRLCVQSFLELRKHHYRIILLLEMISKGNEHLRCFSGDSKRVIDDMRRRFCPDMHDNAVADRVHALVDESLDNWTTTWYDRYQKCFVGVF